MIHYFIRTTNERKLDESISRELGENYTLLVDTEHNPVGSFINQLKIINDYNAILLEDDVILCKNFKTKIESIIKKYKNNIINFFTKPNDWFTTHITLKDFRYNQCTYYPKGLSDKVADEIINFYKKYKYGYDVLEDLALRKLDIPHVQYRPCLVQHKDIKSIINPRVPKRITPYFIDYLEELNINYKKAYLKENKEKLINLMNERFTNYERFYK